MSVSLEVEQKTEGLLRHLMEHSIVSKVAYLSTLASDTKPEILSLGLDETRDKDTYCGKRGILTLCRVVRKSFSSRRFLECERQQVKLCCPQHKFRCLPV